MANLPFLPATREGKPEGSIGLGTTRALTGSTGTTTDTLSTDAFGNTVSSTGSSPSPFGFVGGAGYQTDSDTGLMLLGHRYYDPSTGRFLSRDPIQAGYNWYTYCGNDPVSAIDPEGLYVVLAGHDDQGNPITTKDRSDYRQAIAYIRAVEPTRSAVDGLASSSTTYTVVIIHDGNDRFDPNTNKVYWDPGSAWQLQDDIGGATNEVQSPALGLGHEFGHGWRKDQSPINEIIKSIPYLPGDHNALYDKPNEKDVIDNIETPAAILLGEPIRFNHRGYGKRVGSPVAR